MWASTMVDTGTTPSRMAVRPLAMWVSPQAISENGSALPTTAMTANGVQARTPRGRRRPRIRATTNNVAAPSAMRAAATVTGGTVSRPILISM